MRILGILVIVAGLVCLIVPSITFFTQDRVVNAGYFHVDVNRPHTIVLNPAAGIIAIAAGILLLVFAPRRV
jgi:hypothetical protein